MTNPLTRFNAHQVENGWVVNVNGDLGCMGTQYVFRTLEEMAEWLKVQVTVDPARAA